MVRKKDVFWEHVEPLDNGRFRCNFCEREFAGVVSSLKSHLTGITGCDVDVCSSVTDDVQAKAFLAIGGPNKKTKHAESSSNLEDCKITFDTSLSSKGLQTSTFKAFVKDVAGYGPGYKLPSYFALRTKLIREAKTLVYQYVAIVKKSWVTTGCTMMSDIWTDKKQRTFINVVAYSPGGDVFMNSIEISKEKKTGSYLKNLLSLVIEDIGKTLVVQFITEKASNFKSAGDMLVGKYPWLYKTRCAAHGMQLLLKDIYEDCDWILLRSKLTVK